MSKQLILTIAVILMITSLPLTASTSDFDGSKSLVCASIFSAECKAGDQECITGAPWMINFPVFLEVDFKANIVTTNKLHETPRTSSINQVSMMTDGHTALQGVEDDFVWSMLIAQETGSMTLTLAGEDIGFIVFGACQPK